MRYAVISDVHANAEALDAVIDDARACGVQRFVSLGDVVGYGPMPDEALSRVRSVAFAAVAGNHDDAVTGRIAADDFIELAGDAVERHRCQISRENLDWLGSLGYVYEGDGFLAVHGDVTEPESFRYVDDVAAAGDSFAAVADQLVFVGHTHRPCVFLTGESGNVYYIEPTDFILEEGKRYIVNPGSVGYPRESGGVCRSSYVIYDTEERSVKFRFLPFAVSSVMQRGSLSARLPKWALWAVAVLIVLVFSLVASISFFRGSPPDADLVMKSLVVPDAEKFSSFRLNLHLAKKSDPVKFRYRFISADGRILDGKEQKVNLYSTREIDIPSGVDKVEISVLRLNKEEKPAIKEFSPVFKPRGR